MVGPRVEVFPVQIPEGFAPSDHDGDGTDLGPTGKECPGYDLLSGFRPRWGGGFDAPRGPLKLAHRAIDIMAAEGAHVVAPSACVVHGGGVTAKGGHHIYLRDPEGWIWYFAHLRDPLAAHLVMGAHVAAGELVGLVGRTGNAVRRTKEGLRGCPHLHLSLTARRYLAGTLAGPDGDPVRYSGKKVDAVPFLRPAYVGEGWRLRAS
jgi:murein DD-endopeptidase MepM/ murein hydrolase activator NlpD